MTVKVVQGSITSQALLLRKGNITLVTLVPVGIMTSNDTRGIMPGYAPTELLRGAQLAMSMPESPHCS